MRSCSGPSVQAPRSGCRPPLHDVRGRPAQHRGTPRARPVSADRKTTTRTVRSGPVRPSPATTRPGEGEATSTGAPDRIIDSAIRSARPSTTPSSRSRATIRADGPVLCWAQDYAQHDTLGVALSSEAGPVCAWQGSRRGEPELADRNRDGPSAASPARVPPGCQLRASSLIRQRACSSLPA